MRRRLLLALLGMALAALAGFAGPLLHSTSAERTQRFVLGRTADLDRFAELAAAGGDRLIAEVRAHVDLYGDAVVVIDARRTPVLDSGMRADEPAVKAALDAALRNQPASVPPDVLPWSSGPVLFARPVGSGTRVTGAVALRSTVDRAAADVGASWGIVLTGLVGAALAFVALALLLARWVLRPVAELERGVRAVGGGSPGAHVSPASGPPELRGLAASFNRMSDAVAESAHRQRALVADTSHQLRNPLAALRLRMDSLAGRMSAEAVPAYSSMVAELDRLESLLDSMLLLASADTAATELAAGVDARCDAGTVAKDRVDSWLPAAERAGVTVVEEISCVPVACSESDLAQVLDVLLDNAIKYAPGGTVRVSVLPGVVRVTDDGPGVSSEDLPRLTDRFWRASGSAPGSGLGLAIAHRLVTAYGGELRINHAEPRGLAVTVELPGGA
ncbi:sensor histidine kinase [Actinokineospora globicatena]|uniref:sensor histidine kinase n=1 Tax=Actinokineospora globicatena TaxID=103729 RepID=UPI0020A3C1FE|nr:HAMP domain-containing sensor histidine kinase [Actinokineospora globicatena]MCP2306528.1 Signal transduction histidine kinase [Actinokineospora globicatena]GLW81959.1 two-component sensor histidine kinase [Actinokineospora globicatena]GLW88753.1 two-component sensor histidine kinase [Actinokineospora globicatena]